MPQADLDDLHERLALPARPARVAAIALNTVRLEEQDARRAIETAEAKKSGLNVGQIAPPTQRGLKAL